MHAITNPFKTDISKVGFKSKQEAISSLTAAYKTAFGSMYFQKPNGSLFKEPAHLPPSTHTSFTQHMHDHVYNNSPTWWQYMYKLELYVKANAQDLLGRSDDTIMSFYQSVASEVQKTITALLQIRDIIANAHMQPQLSDVMIDEALSRITTLQANLDRLTALSTNTALQKLKKEKDTLKRKTEVIDVLSKVVDCMITANKSAITQLTSLNQTQSKQAAKNSPARSKSTDDTTDNINKFYELREEKMGGSMPPEERWANAEVWIQQLKELSKKINAVSKVTGRVTEQRVKDIEDEYNQFKKGY